MNSSPNKAIEVVAALILRENRLLACQRKENGSFALKWEFPGGKVEAGETDPQALLRELREELAIEMLAATPVFSHRHIYPDSPPIDLRFFRVLSYRGQIKNLVFQRVAWVQIQELEKMDFLEGDLPLIRKLSSPEGNHLLG